MGFLDRLFRMLKDPEGQESANQGKHTDSEKAIKAVGAKFVCDFISGYSGQTPASVRFSIPDHPGYFMINDELYSAMTASGFKNIGVCSQNMYDRISCGDLLFYTKKGTGNRLLSELRKTRSFCSEEFKAPAKKNFSTDYLGENMKYFEMPYVANISGVSYSYDSDTPKVISRLSVGDKLYLRRWEESPDDHHSILVFTGHFEQIGYLELPGMYSPLDAELRKQLEFGLPFSATVLETGRVQDTDIWWCTIQINFNVPYPADSEMTYITGFGRPYHSRKGCCRADWEVPLCWVQKYNVRPCKKCHKE